MDLAQQIRDKGLKATPSRLEVMSAMGDTHLAYSHADLELLFNRMDRVTLYRVLNDFEEAGIVHKIIDIAGVTRFALCNDACPGGHHVDGHVHFNCTSCHKMFCLETTESPVVKTPHGFVATGFQTIVYGYCNTCSAA
jgi:Fur family ferric uptake transcriptional regulator